MTSCGVSISSSASDEHLARGVREGEDRAFEVLYERHWRALARYAGRLLGDPQSGEDAAQVALANALRALRAGQSPRAVRPWLYGIARNAAWQLHAERLEAVELPSTLEAQAEPPAHESAELTAAVAQLPQRQRAVFALRELRGASNGETAALLGLRESQVEQLLFAGRARLAELLVFGDSVSCEAVGAAGSARLDRHERRALKRHAHHCADCRELLGGRLRLGARLLTPVEALRRLIELLVGASAPAKAGASAAIAVAACLPLLVPAVRSPDEPVRRQAEITAVAASIPDVIPPPRRVVTPEPVEPARPIVHVPGRVSGTIAPAPPPAPAPTATTQPAPVATPEPAPVVVSPPVPAHAPPRREPTRRAAPPDREPVPARPLATSVRTASTPTATRPAAQRTAEPVEPSSRPAPTQRVARPTENTSTTVARAEPAPSPAVRTETTPPMSEPLVTPEPVVATRREG
jgi:RNA polymerase sigma factor (sigma-70 family)